MNNKIFLTTDVTAQLIIVAKIAMNDTYHAKIINVRMEVNVWKIYILLIIIDVFVLEITGLLESLYFQATLY